MKKPSIGPAPRPGNPRDGFDAAIKETLEILTGQRGAKLGMLTGESSMSDIINKINEVASLLQGQDAQKIKESDVVKELPPGAVSYFARNSLPAGWLECNGATVSRTTYSDLFSALGTMFGAGDGSTTFKLPDFRGEFLRGWDNSRGVDPGRSLGAFQDGATKLLMNGSSTTSSPEGNSSTGIITHKPSVEMIGIEAAFWGSYTNRVSLRGAMDTTWGGGAETRPRNFALLVCIKT